MKTLLIGDNAFIGVSHLSQSQAREKIEQFSVEDVARVLNKAAFCGATGFTFTVHPTNFSILGAHWRMQVSPNLNFGRSCPTQPDMLD